MRITAIYLSQQGGGAALDFLELAIGLSNHAEVLCVVSSESACFWRWEEEAKKNAKFRVLGIKTTKNPVKGLLSFLNFEKFHKIRKEINLFCPDVIYSHATHPWERAIVPYLKCKRVFKARHDINQHEGEDSLREKLEVILFLYKPEYYIVYSEFSKKELCKKGIDAKDIFTVSLGSCSLLSKTKNLDLTYYGRFLFFGRLIKYKGIDILLNSLPYVFKEHPEVKLVLAGRGDITEYEPLLTKYKDNIELHNEWILDEDVEKYYKDVDFVVAPYINATQSGVVPLSYYFGKPVIISDNGGLPEQVVEGETGSVFETGNSEQLAQLIISYFSDKEELKRKKQKSFVYSDEVSWNATAKRLYGHFVSVVGDI